MVTDFGCCNYLILTHAQTHFQIIFRELVPYFRVLSVTQGRDPYFPTDTEKEAAVTSHLTARRLCGEVVVPLPETLSRNPDQLAAEALHREGAIV